MRSKITLCEKPFRTLKIWPQPQARDYPQDTFKNLRPHEALQKNITPYCKSIIQYMLEQPDEGLPYAYVDVKVHQLRPGDRTTPANFWHLDSSMMPDYPYSNYLFVTGFGALTQFIAGPVKITPTRSQQDLNKELNAIKPRVTRIPSAQVIHYNGNNLHRGVVAERAETRLLLRVVKTTRKAMPVIRDYRTKIQKLSSAKSRSRV